ncbi:MAG: FAD-binding protein, partial [Acidobacteriaceae bacterium]|nr:FAD-binding protein [Acidobacteriaceae bacterium]
MDKRQFLKTSGALVAGAMCSRMVAEEPPAEPRTNWAGNYEYRAARLHLPKSAPEVQAIVKASGKVKALGARHSFNGIADTTEDQISLKNLEQMELDRKAHTVTIGAGVKYGKLSPYLYTNGYALHNLAS